METSNHEKSEPIRFILTLRGAVQGVGFRPFVYRLATSMKLSGTVTNTLAGVVVEIEGERAHVDEFFNRLHSEKPPHAAIHALETRRSAPTGVRGFRVLSSDATGEKSALVLPDIATCDDCLAEIFDPANRRYRYPFTNCTNCGPRYSIIESLPYDRANTSMKRFVQCNRCLAEYENPQDRRFHAQPNACPDCGPRLELWDGHGKVLFKRDNALLAAARAIAQGHVVAVKGLGGFHLMALASDAKAIERLRQRKGREAKPFALMAGSIEQIRRICETTALEESLLQSPEAPIALLRRNPRGPRQPAIESPEAKVENPLLGVMLPYTPLHHLLTREIGEPVVATSGNLADEPIQTDNRQALERLGQIADFFLMHNRPIRRAIDDSIVRVVADRPLMLRRARGHAPLPIPLGRPLTGSVLAAGAHLKNALAVGQDFHVFISQHIGDLDTSRSIEAYRLTVDDMRDLHGLRPQTIVHDAHPDYASTHEAIALARRENLAIAPAVQHHHAHVRACMAENRLEGEVLGVAWDGAGLGDDGSIWGGEFLLVNGPTLERVACFRPFRLPGGETAMREPRRSALGALYAMLGPSLFERDDLAPLRAFAPDDLATLRHMLETGLQSPFATSAGRLFDALASILDLRQISQFEGQAAAEIEYAAEGFRANEAYPIELTETAPSDIETGLTLPPLLFDWAPLLKRVLGSIRHGRAPGEISASFHNALAEGIASVAHRVGCEHVALSGGCFQNRCLTERAIAALRREGFRPYWHRNVPPGDGGVALGQIAALAASRG